MQFSVLMSLYFKEKPEYFRRALESIWDDQILKPNEIVLVLDGQITDGLMSVIDDFQIRLGQVFKVIPIEQNVGLGKALNIGLQHCMYDYIARMDTDDIALPDRFEKQIRIISSMDVDGCGGWVTEFSKDENIIDAYRKVPEYNDQIGNFIGRRNPINHPTVIFKKEAVLRSGGYEHMLWFEDYYLWARMIKANYIFYNIQSTLVNMRSGFGQLERRRGGEYAKAELIFYKKIFSLDIISLKDFIFSICTRPIMRIMPRFIIKNIYILLHKK